MRLSWSELGRRLGVRSPAEHVELDDEAEAARFSRQADEPPDDPDKVGLQEMGEHILTILRVSNKRREENERLRTARFAGPRIPDSVEGLTVAELVAATRLGWAANAKLGETPEGRTALAAMNAMVDPAATAAFSGTPGGRVRELMAATQLGRDVLARQAASGGVAFSASAPPMTMAHRAVLAREPAPTADRTRKLLEMTAAGREALAKGRVSA